MTDPYPQECPEFQTRISKEAEDCWAKRRGDENPRPWNDDQARSPAAERLRRREKGMRVTIIMRAAYKGAAAVRQSGARAGRSASCVDLL
jgi:hypothetical protein